MTIDFTKLPVALAIFALLLGFGSEKSALASPPQVQRIQERPTFRADVEVATLNVAVLDDKELPVAGLRAADFAVIEDGVPRDIAFLLDPEETPLDVGVLVDLSSSMDEAPWHARTEAFLASLRPGDCVFLLGFNETIGQLAWAAPSAPGLLDYLNLARNDGGTKLYDATLAALRELSGNMRSTLTATPSIEPDARHALDAQCPVASRGRDQDLQRRSALVLVTDGWDTLSEYGLSDVLLWALNWKIPIFQIFTVRSDTEGPESIRPPSETRDRRIRVRVVRERSLDKLTRPTGGRVIDKDSGYEKLLDMLRANYIIGYRVPRSQERPLAELTTHQIEIEVHRKGVRASYSPVVYRSTDRPEVAREERARGVQLVREGTLGEAIAAFDAAILADPSAADSYYQRARALVLLGRADEALQDALRAAAVDPGVPMLHELVAQLALNPTEAQLALEHGVVAAHGGIDMRAHFDSLAPLLADPAEIQERLRAPRFVVRALSSDNPNPVIDAALRAKGLVALRRALVASSHLGVVIDPALATHALLVEATELSEGPPRQLTIRIEMVDPAGERLYQQNVILHNIDDPDATSADLATFLVVVGARLRAAVASVGFNRR